MARKDKIKNSLIDLALAYKALDSANDGITITDMKQPDYPLIFINKAFKQITGYNEKEVLGQNCRFLQGDVIDQPERAIIRKAIKNHKSCRVVLKNFKKDGTLFWNEISLSPIIEPDKTLSYYIGIQKDITIDVMHKQQIAYIAEHDELTGLDNYRGFFTKMDDLILRGKKLNLYLAIGIADIDYFKKINDQYGHVKANDILRSIGSHCREEFRDYDIVARFGGDEFCFACLTNTPLSDFFYEKIKNVVNKVNAYLAGSLTISMSPGMSIEKISNKTRIDRLIHLADCAMYKHKQNTRNS